MVNINVANTLIPYIRQQTYINAIFKTIPMAPKTEIVYKIDKMPINFDLEWNDNINCDLEV